MINGKKEGRKEGMKEEKKEDVCPSGVEDMK